MPASLLFGARDIRQSRPDMSEVRKLSSNPDVEVRTLSSNPDVKVRNLSRNPGIVRCVDCNGTYSPCRPCK